MPRRTLRRNLAPLLLLAAGSTILYSIFIGYGALQDSGSRGPGSAPGSNGISVEQASTDQTERAEQKSARLIAEFGGKLQEYKALRTNTVLLRKKSDKIVHARKLPEKTNLEYINLHRQFRELIATERYQGFYAENPEAFKRMSRRPLALLYAQYFLDFASSDETVDGRTFKSFAEELLADSGFTETLRTTVMVGIREAGLSGGMVDDFRRAETSSEMVAALRPIALELTKHFQMLAQPVFSSKAELYPLYCDLYRAEIFNGIADSYRELWTAEGEREAAKVERLSRSLHSFIRSTEDSETKAIMGTMWNETIAASNKEIRTLRSPP